MTAHALDTLAIAGKLKAAGFSDQQAEAMTFVLRDANDAGLSDAATKADLASLKSELQTGIQVVRQELQAMRTELKTDIEGLRTELKTDIEGLRTELKNDLYGLRTELRNDAQGLRTELKNELYGLRTELKSDNHALGLTFEARIESAKSETIKWVVSAIGFQTLVLVGAVVAMSRMFQP